MPDKDDTVEATFAAARRLDHVDDAHDDPRWVDSADVLEQNEREFRDELTAALPVLAAIAAVQRAIELDAEGFLFGFDRLGRWWHRSTHGWITIDVDELVNYSHHVNLLGVIRRAVRTYADIVARVSALSGYREGGLS